MTFPTAAIIAAGGLATRLGGPLPKQFATLGGRPVLGWSLDVMLEIGCSPVVVVAPPDHLAAASAIASDRDVIVVTGGPTRQASVANGLAQVEAERVLVHDAARPFVSRELVLSVAGALDVADAAVPAIRVDHTLKRGSGREVTGTIDRSDLWMAQTPQGFRTEALRAAHARAVAERFTATDDAALIEWQGGAVVLVEGLRSNLKLTYPVDLTVAEAMVKMRTWR